MGYGDTDKKNCKIIKNYRTECEICNESHFAPRHMSKKHVSGIVLATSQPTEAKLSSVSWLSAKFVMSSVRYYIDNDLLCRQYRCLAPLTLLLLLLLPSQLTGCQIRNGAGGFLA